MATATATNNTGKAQSTNSGPYNGQPQKTYAFQPKWTTFKPNNKGDGAMASVRYSPEEGSFFLQMLTQNPEANDQNNLPRFLKDSTITAKLEAVDIGEFLAVLRGRKEGCGTKGDKGFKGLYHQSQSGTSIINLEFSEQWGYSLSLSVDRGGSKSRLRVSLTLSEVEVLRVFFERYLGASFDLQDTKPRQNTQSPQTQEGNIPL